MKTQLKKITVLLFVLTFTMISYGQKTKKTHDSKTFVKKVRFSMTPDLIGKWSPNEDALRYIASKTDKSLSELKAENKVNKAAIKEDAAHFINQQLAYILDKIEVKTAQETPFKMADIIMYCHTKQGEFTIKLTNCVQTNISWYLGDRIITEGEGVELFTANKQAKAEKVSSSKFLNTLTEIGTIQKEATEFSKEQQEIAKSLRQLRPGYETKSAIYYDYTLSDLPLPGYYIKNNGEKVEAIIGYLKPQFLMGLSNSLLICKEVTGKKLDYLNTNQEPNFKEFLPYADIKAFFVANQLYIKTQRGEITTLITEGAIHTSTSVKLTNPDKQHFTVYMVTQKLNGRKYGTYLDKISEYALLKLMEDAPEIVQGYKEGLYDLNMAEIKYNIWYEKRYPGRVAYIFGINGGEEVEEPSAIAKPKSAAVLAYEKEYINKANEAHVVPKVDHFEGRPDEVSKEIASAKPEVKQKKEKFLARINRIKADGNKVGVLVRCGNLYVNPDKSIENSVHVVGSYGPLNGIERIANKTAEEFNKGFKTDVFETVDYSLIPIREGNYGRIDDWWATKYKIIIIYDITPFYTAVRQTINATGEKEFKAQMKVKTEVYVMAAEDKQKARLKYITNVPQEWAYYASEPFIGPGNTNFDIIQDLKAVINPPEDSVVIDELIKTQQSKIDKFINKKLK